MGSKKNNLRWTILRKGVVNLLLSPLFSSIIVVAICSLLWLIIGWIIPFLGAIALIVLRFKPIVFEFFIMTHVIEESLGLWPWYTKIDEGLFLGAIPMEGMNHLSVLTLDLGITHVLSIVQPFELITSTLAGLPVSEATWQKEGVNQLVLSCADFYLPPHDILDRGADYINSAINKKKKVYVHCKSGIGRSASAVAAYLIKYRGMPVNAAVNHIRSQRPVIFGPTSKQMTNMVLYEAMLKQRERNEIVNEA